MTIGDFRKVIQCYEQSGDVPKLTNDQVLVMYELMDMAGKGYSDELDFVDLCGSMNIGPPVDPEEMAEVDLIRESLANEERQRKEARWNKVASGSQQYFKIPKYQTSGPQFSDLPEKIKILKGHKKPKLPRK